MLLIDCKFLASQLYKLIRQTIIFFKIRNIDNREYNISKYCKFDFYIIGTYNKASIIAYFKQEIYVIDSFWTKVLINIDIIKLKIIFFDIIYKEIIIDNCKIIVSFFVILKRKRIKRKLRS